MRHAARPWPSTNLHLVTTRGNGGCRYTLRNPFRHGFVERAEEWEWSSFRVSARLSPAPRRHLVCEPFDRLLELDTEQYPLPTLRAYVLETDLESATTAA